MSWLSKSREGRHLLALREVPIYNHINVYSTEYFYFLKSIYVPFAVVFKEVETLTSWQHSMQCLLFVLHHCVSGTRSRCHHYSSQRRSPCQGYDVFGSVLLWRSLPTRAYFMEARSGLTDVSGAYHSTDLISSVTVIAEQPYNG